jgi:hypothetical protein
VLKRMTRGRSSTCPYDPKQKSTLLCLRIRKGIRMKLYFGSNTDKPVTAALDVQGYLEEDKKHQYRDGYSMAEAAKSWVSAGEFLPKSIMEIVGSDRLRTRSKQSCQSAPGGE